MEDQRDLISNHEQLPMLGQRPGAPESKCSRGALYTGFSVLVALLLAGQATTAYFLYQQQGRLDKLTVTSQNLQLESLRMKLPKPSKPLSKMRVSAPMLMQALPMEGPEPMRNATKYGNMTQDHVMHLLLKSDPLGVYPKLKGSLPENLKHLTQPAGSSAEGPEFPGSRAACTSLSSPDAFASWVFIPELMGCARGPVSSLWAVVLEVGDPRPTLPGPLIPASDSERAPWALSPPLPASVCLPPRSPHMAPASPWILW
uniref:CD74 molecule n=1 Tax=Sus scrofa TaxID=9823 RepID=A0A8D1V607_PIG